MSLRQLLLLCSVIMGLIYFTGYTSTSGVLRSAEETYGRDIHIITNDGIISEMKEGALFIKELEVALSNSLIDCIKIKGGCII